MTEVTSAHISETRIPQTIQWEMATDIGKAVDTHEDRLKERLKQLGWDDDETFKIGLTFREWLVNAMVHGNMGPLQKEEVGEEAWDKVIEERQKQAQATGKKVRVTGSVSDERVELIIQDQGKETREFWLGHRRSPVKEGLMDTSNRGWYLAEHLMNSISFKKTPEGLEVTLIRDKNLPLPK